MANDAEQLAAELAVECWRLHREMARMAARLPLEDHPRFDAQLRFARAKLERLTEAMGLRLEEFDGQPFTASLPASATNADEMTGADAVVSTTLEPVVMQDGRVIRFGKVTLREER
jgi:hypothetical protein